MRSAYHRRDRLLFKALLCEAPLWFMLSCLGLSQAAAQELTIPEEVPAALGEVEVLDGVEPYVELIVRGGSFEVLNRSPYSLTHLARGEQEITELPPGSSWSGEERPLQDLFGQERPLRTLGQFKLSEWGEAMSETLPVPPRRLTMSAEEREALERSGGGARTTKPSQRAIDAHMLLAELHLRTAGMSPVTESLSEVVMTSGTPLIEPNVIALRQSAAPLTLKWLEGDHPLQTALVAHAALFAPPSLLLKELFAQLDPKAVSTELERWRPVGYERLRDAHELVRDAFERHAQEALPALMTSPEWSEDRGFGDPLLALVLGEPEQIFKALNSREDKGAASDLQRRADRLMGAELDTLFLSFLEAQRERGSRGELRVRALELAYRLDRVDQRPEVSLSARALCGTLDASTQSSLNQGQLLAARSYLQLAQRVCHGSAFFMMRAASLMTNVGDRGYFRGDFESAQHWYRAALMLRDDPMSRVKFIDTLSQLALRANVEGDFKRARRLIEEARDWDSTALPHRELLALADQMMPRADHRARLGLILLIAVLGVIVTIRLLRVFTEQGSAT